MIQSRLLTILLLVAIHAWPVAGADPVDPAPPQVTTLTAQPAAKPKPLSTVTFHAAAKPLPQGAVTEDWPWFLGPAHHGVSSETKLLKTWPKSGPSAVWELERGDGYASPSIVGDYLVYPHRVKDEVIVECLHPETGASYWQFRYPTNYQDRYGYSNGPRASAVIDGNRVYLLGVEGQFFCLELSTGRLVWQRNINSEFKVTQDFFGTVTSPLLEGDLLIINVGGPQACVVAFDKHTGKAVWRSGDGWGPSYASPTPATIHGQRRVFVFAGGDSDPPKGGLLCLNPASGKIDFQFPWRSRKYESVNACCPVVINDSVFISATYRTGSTLLKLDRNFQPTPVWTMTDRENNTSENELGIHWGTPVYKDGYLYAFDGRNEPDASLVCVNAATGKVVWREIPEWEETVTFNGRTERIGASTLRGSLLHVDGHFLCVGELGHLLWLDLSPKGYREISRTWLFGAAQTWAPPIVRRGLLYMTQNSRDIITRKPPRLLCYDLRAESPAK